MSVVSEGMSDMQAVFEVFNIKDQEVLLMFLQLGLIEINNGMFWIKSK